MQAGPDETKWKALMKEEVTRDDPSVIAELSKPPTTCIIHLDPIASGGHNTKAIGKGLCMWLQYALLYGRAVQ
jgi:hypothetical protein